MIEESMQPVVVAPVDILRCQVVYATHNRVATYMKVIARQHGTFRRQELTHRRDHGEVLQYVVAFKLVSSVELVSNPPANYGGHIVVVVTHQSESSCDGGRWNQPLATEISMEHASKMNRHGRRRVWYTSLLPPGTKHK